MSYKKLYRFKVKTEYGIVKGSHNAYSKLSLRDAIHRDYQGKVKFKDILVWNPEKDAEPTF